jgi:hypothetical protein
MYIPMFVSEFFDILKYVIKHWVNMHLCAKMISRCGIANNILSWLAQIY